DEADRPQARDQVRIGRFRESDRWRAVPELLLDERDGERIGEIAGEDEDVGLLALDGRADVVERRDESRLDAVALEPRVHADAGLDVVQREERPHAPAAGE